MEASISFGKKLLTGRMDKKARDELIMKYAPLVKNIVLRMAVKFPMDGADKEDLINVGIIGLMSAIEKYDSSRNVQFETYARFRIKGAVLDELRARDWVPRSTRSKDNKLEKAFATLQRVHGRQPVEEEIAQYLGLSLDEYYALLDEVKTVSLVSTEDIAPDYLERSEKEEFLGAINRGSPLDYVINRNMMEGLKKAIDTLPEKEKLVLSLYYYEELTMKEIGKVIDLTESRVCQLHAQATLRLRGVVKEYR
jgi:RNA polymerase sigma factor FliA